MSEPNVNLRRQRALRRTIYSLTRRYGEQVTLRKLATNDVDYTDGSRDRTYTTLTVRNAVRVPALSERVVEYTPAMMQAIRKFAWQGNGYDAEESGFLIYDKDIPDWGTVDSTQSVLWRDRPHEVTKVQEFDGGVLLWTKRVVQS